MGKFKTTRTQRFAVFLSAVFSFVVFSQALFAGVLTLVKSQNPAVVNVGDTVNYCIAVNPQYVTPKADIVWVIDRSYSMDIGIANIRDNLAYFTQQLSGRHVDYRNGLLTFVDGMYENYGFAENDTKFKSWLNTIECTGGTELDLEALNEANKFPWRQDASKTMILITDEGIPCSEAGGDALSVSITATNLFSQGVIIHAITFNPDRYGYVSWKCNPIFLPPLAGGIWLDYNTPSSGWNIFLEILGEAVANMNNVVIRDPLPPQLAPVPGSLNGGTVTNNQIVWNYDQIDRGVPFSVCFDAVVTAPFSGQLINTAYGSADGITETASNDTFLLKATPTVTPTFTPTYTYTCTFTRTYTATVTPTYTATPTFTPSFTQTYSVSPTFTMTGTYTATPTYSYTCTPTFTMTPSPTATITVTGTYTATPTYTCTPSFTGTLTATPTYTITKTASPTYTCTASPTVTATFTCTMIATSTFTFTPTQTATKDHDHFIITAPASVKAGVPFYITVTAMTSAMYGNLVADNYGGTLHLGTSAAAFALPDDYAYIPASDFGSHIFQVVLITPGMQTITGNDVFQTTMTGMTSVLVTNGDALNFTINAPSSVAAGDVFYITVTAKDAFNNIATAYTGTASFSSTDYQWVSPGDTQFTAADLGKKILAVIMKTSGIQRIYCQDTSNPAINGASNDINVLHGPLNKFLVTAPSVANANVAFNYAVTAQDRYNNTINDYTGKVHFTVTDAIGVLPADYTFQLTDSGSRVFAATLATTGIQTISVFDTVTPAVTGTSNNINVVTPSTSYSQPLLLTSYLTAANTYELVYIYVSSPANVAIPNNAYLEYDVFMPEYNADFYTGTEFVGSFGIMRDYGQGTQAYIIDQNGIRCHPSMDLGGFAKGRWYHRKMNISSLNGTTCNQVELSQDTGNIGYNGAPSNKAGTFNAVYDNIQFKDSSGNVLKNFFANFNTIPFNNSVMVDGNIAGNRGNGGISNPAPLNNYIWVVKDYTLSQSPAGSITANGVNTCNLTAHLFAPDNTSIAYALVDFTSNRPEDIIAPLAVSLNATAITDWNGNASASIRSTKAGSANITVRSAHMSKIITVNFTAGPAAKLNLDPVALSMQTGMTGTMYASITDQFGNLVSDTRNITVNSNSGTMQFSTDNGGTWAASAVFQGTQLKSMLVKDSVSNTATVTASASGLTLDTSTVYVNNAPASILAVQPLSSTTAAGAPHAITIQAKDLGGANAFSNNIVQVSSASTTMKFSTDQAAWSSTLTLPLNNGRAGLYYMDTAVGSGITITAHDTLGLLADGKGYAAITAGVPALLTADSNKYSTTAGQWVIITAQVTDAYGNPILGQWVTGTAMVQSGKTQNAAVTSLSNTTNAAGHVTISFKVSSDATGSMNYVVINSPGLLGTTITISASSAATHMAFLPAPMSEGADKIGTLYINAKDANGYNSPATVSPDYVTVSANSTNVFFSLDKITWTNSVVPKFDNGGAVTVYVKSHITGTYTLTSHDGHITDGTDTLLIVTGYFVRVSPSINSNAVAGTYMTITAQIIDQNGTAVNMQGVHVDFATDNGSIDPLESVTDTTGKATALLTLSILANINHRVTVKITNPDDTQTSGIITTTPDISFAISAPASVFKGQQFTINVRAKDAYGATVDNYINTVVFSSTDGAAQLPANYGFVLSDAGVRSFTVILNTDGIKSISVRQLSDSSITGTSPNILVMDPPTATFTVTPTRTATGTFTATPTVTQTVTQTITMTITQTVTQTVTKTITSTFTLTATDTITPTCTGTQTVTPTATQTYTGTPTNTCTNTPSATPTFSSTMSETNTYTVTLTYTITFTDTVTPTLTETPPYTATATPTATQTVTQTVTETITPTISPTFTVTATPTFSASPTCTSTAYQSSTVTQTSTITRTSIPTATATNTQIPLDIYEYDGSYTNAKPIYSWQRQRHNVVPEADADWMVITLNATSSVTIETSGDAVDTEMWLYDAAGVASGTSIAYDDDGGEGACSKIVQTLSAGTYYVLVQAYGNDEIIPEYFVDLTVLGPDVYENDNTYTSAKYINNGDTQVHSIFPVGDNDWVKFDVAATSAVDIYTGGATGDTLMYLYNSAGVASGSYIYSNDDICGAGCGYNYFSEIKAVLAPGTYYAMIQQYGQSQIISSYNLTLNLAQTTPTPTATMITADSYEADNTYTTAKVILSGVQQQHSIHTATDVDWVKFDVTQTSVVNINTSGLSGDTAIYLYSSAGVPSSFLAMDDNSGIGYFSNLNVTLDPGTYYVKVQQVNMSAIIPSYYLKVTVDVIIPTCTPTLVSGDMYENDNTFPNAKDILMNTSQAHSIHVPSDVDWVKITLTQESIVHIWTTGSMSDTEMNLYDSAGVPSTPLAYDDNGGSGFFSSITKQLMPGIYYVKVNEKNMDQTIDLYYINLNVNPISPTPTQTPVTADAYEYDNVYANASWIYNKTQQVHSIDVISDVDWVKFTIGISSMVVVQTSGATGSTDMWLYDETGVVTNTPLASNSLTGGFAVISKILPAGTYYVKVAEQGQDSIIPQYFLSLDVSQNTPTVTPTVTATITPTSIYGDMYEPDNSFAIAGYIYDGIPQKHTIIPANDVDWVKFDITNTSVIVLSTSGAGQTGDTELYLYTSAGGYITADDNSGGDYWSMISRTLTPGTYYAAVIANHYYDPSYIPWTIADYTLSLSVAPLTTMTATRTAIVTNTNTSTVTMTASQTPAVTATVTPTAIISFNQALDNFILTFNSSGNTLWNTETSDFYYNAGAAQSGPIGNNMQSYVNAVINGPGSLSFFWKISSEAQSDTLALYDGNIKVQEISGEAGWTQVNYMLTSGAHNIRWEYAKDNSGSVGADAGWLDRVEYIFMTATQTPVVSVTVTATATLTPVPTIDFVQAVDSSGYIYNFFGANAWFGEASTFYFGSSAGQSGAVADSQNSSASTTIAGPGNLSFYWKVSSQPGSDYLKLYIDGVLTDLITGSIDWTLKNYSLSAGNHVIRWTYDKDAAGSSGSDCGWIDRVMCQIYTATPTFTITQTCTITPTYTNTPSGGGWTSTGLWHLTADALDPAGHTSVTVNSWYYGRDINLNYYTGIKNTGDLISPVYLNLPAGAVFSFMSWERTRYNPAYDTRKVYISTNNGATWTLLRSLYGNENIWYQVNISLAAYAGQSIRLKLSFDTVDAGLVYYRGWYVDDITMITPTPTVTPAGTVTLTGTCTSTKTYTLTITQTSTGTNTATFSATVTATPSVTNTRTFTCTITATSTATPEAGLWHQVPSILSPAGRTSVSGNPWYYGIDKVLNYDTGGRTYGSLISPEYLNIVPGAVFSFYSWEETENSTAVDTKNIYISTDEGVSWILARNLYNNEDTWYQVTIDLSAYAGRNILFRFEFDSDDGYDNVYRGWYVDDMSVYVPAATFTATETVTSTVCTLTQTSTQTNTATATNTITGTPPTATYTYTATNTVDLTAMPTAVDTAIDTITATPTVTGTITSGTQTPTLTITATLTTTQTGTQTVFVTQTNTSTVTATLTITQTETQTMFVTQTNTPTITATLTITQTETQTMFVTQTNSPTITATSTITQTGTQTMFVTRTNTEIVTDTAVILTCTFTPTGTVDLISSPTCTNTFTFTGTITFTATMTITGTPPTDTITPTRTKTAPATRTNTPTKTVTSTYTATETFTKTATGTGTITQTFTVTVTFTPTATYTQTETATMTYTLTETPVCSNTPVFTMTVTPSATQTMTATLTVTPTANNTITYTNTATAGITVQPSLTSTPVCSATITPVLTQIPAGKLNSYVYPQPASEKITFVYSLEQAASVKIAVYNTAGMDVAVINHQGTATNNNKVEYSLSSLAPGTYYYIIKVYYGEKTESYRPGKFLVIK